MKHNSHKSGFTMIELIGAMIIIAVLTAAGITAVTTAINNSRITAVNEDLNGFRKVSEQFLLDNPQNSKWNGKNTPDQLKDAFNLFNDKYLEGEMKLEHIEWSKNCIAHGKTQRKDPWGNSYDVVYHTFKINADAQDTSSFARIFIRSRGKNGTHATETNPTDSCLSIRDSDDIYSVTQFCNGKVASTQFNTANVFNTYGACALEDYAYDETVGAWSMYVPCSTIPGYKPWGD